MNATFSAEYFTRANNEKDGNIYYSVKEGYSHDGRAANEYFYNALSRVCTVDTGISDVINDPVFGDWGRMIFPVNTSYWSGGTLGNLSLTWYRNINAAHTVEICNYLKDRTLQGERVFYDIYTAEEKAAVGRT